MQEENVPKKSRRPKMKFGLTWLLVIPVSLGVIVTYYIPVAGGTLPLSFSKIYLPRSLIVPDFREAL